MSTEEEQEKRVAEQRAKNAVRAKAAASWKSFLESTPPNTPVEILGIGVQASTDRGARYQHLPKTRLQLHCENDGGVRWFDCSRSEIVLREPWQYEFIAYGCRDCGRYYKTFAVVIARDSDEKVDGKVMKLGELPSVQRNFE